MAQPTAYRQLVPRLTAPAVAAVSRADRRAGARGAPAGAELTISPAPGTPGRLAADADQRPRRRPGRIESVRVTRRDERRARRPPARLLRRPRCELRPSTSRSTAGRARRRRRSASAAARRSRSSFTVAHLGPDPAASQPAHDPAGKLQQFVTEARADPAARSACCKRSPEPARATSSSPRCPRRSCTRAATTRSRSRRSGPAGR